MTESEFSEFMRLLEECGPDMTPEETKILGRLCVAEAKRVLEEGDIDGAMRELVAAKIVKGRAG